MGKEALKKKLREIQKAVCLQVDEKYFEPLHKDVMCWKSWNALHAIAEAMSCDVTYVLLIEECSKSVIRNYLGDKC